MSKHNSTHIIIEQNNEVVHNCMECNKKLNQYEYNRGMDTCTTCKDKFYSKKSGRSFMDIDGINRIDDVLVHKYKMRER